MIREYVEHKFNGTMRTKCPFYPHRKTWFARCAIRVDGVIQAYAAWDYKEESAKKVLRTYLSQECLCIHPSNALGKTPPCPVHKHWQ